MISSTLSRTLTPPLSGELFSSVSSMIFQKNHGQLQKDNYSIFNFKLHPHKNGNNRDQATINSPGGGHGEERKGERDDASKITQKFNRGLSPITLPYYPEYPE
jgi:hypothetical protein